MDELQSMFAVRLNQLHAAIQTKHVELSRAQKELSDLVATQQELTEALRVLQRHFPQLPLPFQSDSQTVEHGSPRLAGGLTEEVKRSLYIGRTALECSLSLLREIAPEDAHYRELARESIASGYRSPKRGSDDEVIEKSFWDALRRAKLRAEVPIVFIGGGRFRYEPDKARYMMQNGIMDDDEHETQEEG